MAAVRDRGPRELPKPLDLLAEYAALETRAQEPWSLLCKQVTLGCTSPIVSKKSLEQAEKLARVLIVISIIAGGITAIVVWTYLAFGVLPF